MRCRSGCVGGNCGELSIDNAALDSDTDAKLVCVLRCCKSSSDVENLFPQ